jgi:GMP synthase-like glutamine amidotransferase
LQFDDAIWRHSHEYAAAMKTLSPEYLGWRMLPGLLGRHASSPQSVHALLGYFLKDRKSPTPFPGRDMLANEGVFDWGLARPLEKVIESEDHLHVLLGMPEIYRQSVAVVEPWASVGTNPRGEPVRASKNIAYICQQVADADTILFPVWQSGIRNPERLANVLSAGIATIVQGGCPSVHDAASFAGASAGLDDMLALIDQLLLRRSTASGPSIFICLGHQLAAASHVRLLQRAVREIGKLARLPLDPSGRVLNSLQRAAERITRMGNQLQVVKQGQPRAIGWNDPDFAVASNENLEVGTRTLLPYVRRDDETHIPRELHEVHALVADELEGVIDQALTLEREITVEMFHADEVNEEAALFANWAYKTLHDTIVPLRHVLAVSPVAWLLSLPYAVEILGQTRVDVHSWTEVGTTAIYYKDWETHRVRRSFTCQFHPELMDDIRDIGGRIGPRYHELKDHDGVRLLVRLLYHGMQE